MHYSKTNLPMIFEAQASAVHRYVTSDTRAMNMTGNMTGNMTWHWCTSIIIVAAWWPGF